MYRYIIGEWDSDNQQLQINHLRQESRWLKGVSFAIDPAVPS